MSENTILTALINVISAGLTERGITVGIVQNYQPTQQGIPTGDTVFIYKLHGHRYGSPERKDVFADNVMTHTETQVWETTFQISALATINPLTPSQLTAGDYCDAVSGVLQSEAGIVALLTSGIGMQRITNVRNPFFKNDRMQFQNDPSFDVTVTYSESVSSIINSGTVVVANVLAT
jgi:E217 gateway protein gp29